MLDNKLENFFNEFLFPDDDIIKKKKAYQKLVKDSFNKRLNYLYNNNLLNQKEVIKLIISIDNRNLQDYFINLINEFFKTKGKIK